MSRLAGWPALVLTAGLGTRLEPLSAIRAKAALPVAGETIISRILRGLAAAGIERVVLNLHHHPATITREVGDGARWGLDVRYSWEWPLLGSAGGPARALPLVAADRFLIVNGDTLTNLDLGALAAAHVASGALVTMAVVAGDTTRYNGVATRGDGTVHAFVPPGPSTTDRVGHFIGVQAVSAAALSGVPRGQPSETVKSLYPRLIAAHPGAVRAFWSDAEFLDVGTPRDYYETARLIAAREGRLLDTGERCSVEPGALVDHSLLWDDVTVRAGASITECIAADGVVVPAGARFSRAALVMRDGHVTATPFRPAP